MGSAPKLYNAWFCPFAQRAWIGMLHKGVPFEYVEQDPYNKTPEWLAVNPRGLVPTVVHNSKSIYDSVVCLEYMDDAWKDTGNSILPQGAYDRAIVRIWCDFITKKMVPPYYAMLLKKGDAEREEAKELLTLAIKEFSENINKEGPFFMGNYMSMVDIMLFPHALRYVDVLSHFRGYQIPTTGPFTHFHQWYENMKKCECVSKTLADTKKLIEYYQRYSDDSAHTQVADAIRQGKALP